MKRFALLLAAAAAVFGQAIPGSYIVEFEGEPALVASQTARVGTAARGGRVTEAAMVAARRAQIAAQHKDMQGRIEIAGGRVTHHYDSLLNAAAVEIDDAAADRLRTLPGVKGVYPNKRYQALLDQAIPLHKIDAAWQSIGGSMAAGAGMKIAILDSGIDATHLGFQNFQTPLPKGFPIVSAPVEKSNVNNKIIVSRDYTGSGGTDRFGHGTSVAMNAAGLTNNPGMFNLNPITGVAPGAWIGNYKILDDDGTTDTITMFQGFQDAVNDGMNVINLSIGTPQIDLGVDSGLEYKMISNAVAAGTLVVVSSGNSGPEAGTVSDPASSPMAIAVGANENTRVLDYAVTLPYTPPYEAAVPNPAPTGLSQMSGPFVDVATLSNPTGCWAYNSGALKNSIAVVPRGGCTFDTKLSNAQAAGAAGVVVYDNTVEGLITMSISTATVPAVFVSQASGAAMVKQLQLYPGLNGTIDFTGYTAIPTSPDVIPFFSARGPSASGTVKPDLVAVGDNVLTALNATQTNAPYTLGGGTSFSAPLVSGAAALLMGARPGLRGVDYRSLLINSAPALANPLGGTQDPQVGGTGRLDMWRALQNNLTATPVSVAATAPADASTAIQTMLFTNIGQTGDTFSVSAVVGVNGAAPFVDSTPFWLDPGQSQTVLIALPGPRAAGTVYSGFLVATGTKSGVATRVPYWFGVPGTAVSQVAILQEADGTTVASGGVTSFIFRLVDAAGIPIGGGPTVTTQSAKAKVLSVLPVGTIPGTFQAQVRVGSGTSSSVFTISAGAINRDVTFYLQ